MNLSFVTAPRSALPPAGKTLRQSKPVRNGLKVMYPARGCHCAIRCVAKSPPAALVPARGSQLPRAVLAIGSLSEKNGKKLIQEGVAGYFEKGFMTPEKLKNAVSGILTKRLLVPDESDANEAVSQAVAWPFAFFGFSGGFTSSTSGPRRESPLAGRMPVRDPSNCRDQGIFEQRRNSLGLGHPSSQDNERHPERFLRSVYGT